MTNLEGKTLILCVTILGSSCVTTLRGEEPAAGVARIDPASVPLLQELASENFAERTAASEKLANLDVKVIVDLARLLPAHHSAETATRLLTELEHRFISDDLDQQVAASEAIEILAEDQRLSVSEAARRSLKLHWQRRIDIALVALKRKGATVKRGHFTPGTTFGWMPGTGPDTTIQLMLGERWKGSEKDIRIFQRLAPILGPVRNRNGLTLFLLDGHPLSDDSVVLLKDIVGGNRVVERSRVALGIQGDRIHRENVLIGEISKGGSADAAGLKVGDLIEAIINPETQDATGKKKAKLEQTEILKDFDDLVQRLRAYRQGDLVTMRVIRDYQSQLAKHQREFISEFDQLIRLVGQGEASRKEEDEAIGSFRKQLSPNERMLSLFDSLIGRLRNEASEFQGIDATQITYYVRSQLRPRPNPEMPRELVVVELFGWERLEAR